MPMKKVTEQLADGFHTLMRVFTVNERLYPSAEGRTKYNAVDFQSIGYLSSHPNCRARDLADYLGVAPTTAQSAIDRLIKRGLVERRPSPHNGRDVALALTQEGLALRAAIRRQDVSNCATILNALPKKERVQFVNQIQRVAAVVSQQEKEPETAR